MFRIRLGSEVVTKSKQARCVKGEPFHVCRHVDWCGPRWRARRQEQLEKYVNLFLHDRLEHAHGALGNGLTDKLALVSMHRLVYDIEDAIDPGSRGCVLVGKRLQQSFVEIDVLWDLSVYHTGRSHVELVCDEIITSNRLYGAEDEPVWSRS